MDRPVSSAVLAHVVDSAGPLERRPLGARPSGGRSCCGAKTDADGKRDVTSAEDCPNGESVACIERRQDEVLRELELLELRLSALLAEYLSLPAASRGAAA